MEDTSILRALFSDELFKDRCVRRVRDDEMHLTFNFLGEVDPSFNARIFGNTDAVALETDAFEVEFRGIGAFPSATRASVVWIGVVDGGETTRINSLLSDRFAALGLRTESRPFHPHITVARVKCRVEHGRLDAALRNWEGASFGTQEVSSIEVKKSELSPGGAVHTALHVSRLRS